MPLHLQLAGTDDLPAIVALMNLAFRATGAQASWNIESGIIAGNRTTEALLNADLAAKPQAHLLLTRESAAEPIQGCVWLEPVTADIWYLGSLAVSPSLQNAGLGRKLLTAAERYAATRSAQTIQMAVLNVRHALIAWYQRRGYQLTGETRPFPYGDNRFGTPLRPDLHFVVLTKSLTTSPQP